MVTTQQRSPVRAEGYPDEYVCARCWFAVAERAREQHEDVCRRRFEEERA